MPKDQPQFGRIVWANFVDPQGKPAGPHPAVILTPNEEIKAGATLAVAVASTKPQYSKPEERVELPWHRNGNVKTKLRQWCAVICFWLVPLKAEDILQYGGFVPSDKMDEILQKIAELKEGKAKGNHHGGPAES